MEDKQALLRRLPSVDQLIKHSDLAELVEQNGHASVTNAIRASIEATRMEVRQEKIDYIDVMAIVRDIKIRLQESLRYRLQPVINATGVILHTNLGRAPLAADVVNHIADIASRYNTLEYDLDKGKRGQRTDSVDSLLQALTGAKAALVTNNNAAAVLLTLTGLCKGSEVIVSRGELVEIGGAFRIPEVMEASGARLKEVGTTNKTRLADYAKAITEQTGALLKVHTSNYRVVGFTEDVDIAALKSLAQQGEIPLIYDLGSGAMTDFSAYGIHGEPTVKQALEAGADLVSFSGDKLLGGPQCGVVVGDPIYIDKLRRHPLMRALRVDKMTLAALEATLQIYRDHDVALQHIPILKMVSMPLDDLRARSEKLAASLTSAGFAADVIDTTGVVGGGSAPTETFPSCAVALATNGILNPDDMAGKLRQASCPVIARIEDGRICFDLRTVDIAEDGSLRDAILKVCGPSDA